ncbi:hypothetical protein BDP27DRAFT_1406093 [Rhodocollybia butyracea]|uniref:Uncharacterized protein n=1 Tax=Rhodocollybia butyracea TaxID=206335 RepID=A0A9P5PCV6_9AGAR|nr:hypothetical protein BDP27DRAFT_1406093 [Rhodocollybia butyracea]
MPLCEGPGEVPPHTVPPFPPYTHTSRLMSKNWFDSGLCNPIPVPIIAAPLRTSKHSPYCQSKEALLAFALAPLWPWGALSLPPLIPSPSTCSSTHGQVIPLRQLDARLASSKSDSPSSTAAAVERLFFYPSLHLKWDIPTPSMPDLPWREPYRWAAQGRRGWIPVDKEGKSTTLDFWNFRRSYVLCMVVDISRNFGTLYRIQIDIYIFWYF